MARLTAARWTKETFHARQLQPHEKPIAENQIVKKYM
jgi:hypothetical protein